MSGLERVILVKPTDRFVRLATQADVMRIVELGCEFLNGSHYAEAMRPDPELMARTISGMIGSQDCFVAVYEVEGVVVGMIGVTATIHPFTGQPVVSELFWYVRPGHRGRAGLKLLKLVERWAMMISARCLIMVSPSERVSRIYERKGYLHLEDQYIRSFN